MRKLFWIFTAVISLVVTAFGQSDRASELDAHVRKILVLNQLVAVVIRPEQARQLLPYIEEATSAETRLRAREVETLKVNDRLIESAVKVAENGDHSDSEQGYASTMNLLNKLAATREQLIEKEVEKVRQGMLKVFDKGQIKSIAVGFDPRVIDTSLDGSKMSGVQKETLFVRMILLDSSAMSYITHKSQSK